MKKLSVAVIVTLIFLTIDSGLAVANPSKLDQVFDGEMLGVDVPYFEQVTGLAKHTYANSKVYKVEGCEVTANTDANTIRSLRIDLSAKCTFDLNKFLNVSSGKFPAPHLMTFGQFEALYGSGHFMADCLSFCGNAADPVVYEHWDGSSANGYTEVMLEVVQNGDGLDAANKWRDTMEKTESKDWTESGKFNCHKKYDIFAHELFKNIKITAITIGKDIEKPSC